MNKRQPNYWKLTKHTHIQTRRHISIHEFPDALQRVLDIIFWKRENRTFCVSKSCWFLSWFFLEIEFNFYQSRKWYFRLISLNANYRKTGWTKYLLHFHKIYSKRFLENESDVPAAHSKRFIDDAIRFTKKI